MKAAASEIPKLSFRALSTRRLVMTEMNSAGLSSAVLRNSAPSGMRTMRPSQVRVRPSVNPKPGITLGLCHRKRSREPIVV
jgi:hypothetical protein